MTAIWNSLYTYKDPSNIHLSYGFSYVYMKFRKLRKYVGITDRLPKNTLEYQFLSFSISHSIVTIYTFSYSPQSAPQLPNRTTLRIWNDGARQEIGG